MTGDEFDRILDEGLASYTRQEPRTGLPGRVLARVRSEGRTSSQHGWFVWVMAAAALACVAVVLVVWRDKSPQPVARNVPVPRIVVAPPPERPVEPLREPIRESASYTPVPVPAEKKRPVRKMFPTVVPVTAQERTLVAISQHAPDLVQWFAEREKPLEIQEIKIEPLAPERDAELTGENK